MNYLNVDDYVNLYEFPLALTLLCLGFNLEALNKEPDFTQRVSFVFPKSSELEKTISEYWAGNLRIEPKLFWSKSRELKSRIRSEIDNGSNK